MTTAPSHIVVVTLENEYYSDIVGNTAEAPFLNQLISEGMLFTNYFGMTHPSQPNYLALFSGSTQGVTGNVVPSEFPASVPTLASALANKGYTFGGYAETGADPQRTPWLDFANSAADAANFSAFPQTAAGFANLPTVSFVTPNDADNMTPISDTGGGIAAGDAWVQANLGAYAAWAENPANNSLLIITFDENNTNPAVTYPDQIVTIVVGAGVPAGVTNGSEADTYSLLSTIESLYGLTPVGVSAGAPALDFYSSTPATAASTITDPFSGISDPTNTPPENAFAVGPDYIFMAETTHYEITDLSGNPIVNGSLYSLFSGLGSTLDNSLLDARAAYDSSTGQYVVIADNFQPVLSGQTNFGTNIDIAVSVDSNPADGWYLASIDTSNGFTTQSDMPYLSVSNGNIYITAPEYLDTGGGYSTGEFVVGESAVIAAGNAAITPDVSNIASASGGIMRNVAGDNGTTYYLSTYSDESQTVLTYQTYDPTNGFSATQTIYLGDADVGGGGSDYTAAQMGTTQVLDIGDSRIQSLAYASSGGHDYVYGVSEVMPTAGSAAEIEWFKLDVTDPANPQFVIGNVISGASIGTDVAVFNPSIAVNAAGDVLINFSASGPDMYPSDYYTVLGAGDASFSSPTLYEASNSYFNSGSTSLINQRWGTYSTAVGDPNNPNGFWLSNEYITTGVTAPTGLSAWWDTINASIVVVPPAPTITSPTDGSSTSNADPTITGTGQSGDTINISIDGSVVGAATVASDDSWNYTPATDLTGGSHTVVATETDTAGTSGSSNSVGFTISETTVSVAYYEANKSTLDLTAGGFSISDTAADISGGLDQLNDPNILSITISDNGAVGVSIAQLTSDATAISKLANQNATPYQLAVTDTASNVTGALSTLEFGRGSDRLDQCFRRAGRGFGRDLSGRQGGARQDRRRLRPFRYGQRHCRRTRSAGRRQYPVDHHFRQWRRRRQCRPADQRRHGDFQARQPECDAIPACGDRHGVECHGRAFDPGIGRGSDRLDQCFRRAGRGFGRDLSGRQGGARQDRRRLRPFRYGQRHCRRNSISWATPISCRSSFPTMAPSASPSPS